MTIPPEALIGLFALLLGVGGNIAYTASRFGYFAAKLEALQDSTSKGHADLDRDIGRLAAKVDNDVHGRKAFAAATERLTRVEERIGTLERADRSETV